MMSNKQKFIEVFGQQTYDCLIKGLVKEEITLVEILDWFFEDYKTKAPVQTEIVKRRGRKPKN